jgi:hypothetical protein
MSVANSYTKVLRNLALSATPSLATLARASMTFSGGCFYWGLAGMLSTDHSQPFGDGGSTASNRNRR